MKKTANHRMISLALTLCLLLATALYFPGPIRVQAALPGADNLGQPNDGVDIDKLAQDGSGIYYGTYHHAQALAYGNNGNVIQREATPTPVLWRAMGEEAGGNLTLLSEYVLDSTEFDTNSYLHVYDTSSIKTFVENMSIFSGAESAYTRSTDVVTRMHELDGSEYIGNALVNYPVTTDDQILYLPWGRLDNDTVYWDAGGDESYSLGQPAAKLKTGTDVYYWLCSSLIFY